MRRQGAYAIWYESQLPEVVQGMITRTTDLSPVMQPLAFEARDETRGWLASGGGSEYPWPALSQETIDRRRREGGSGSAPGIGIHGGFASGITAVWSFKNFGWITRAPHAHLFSQGAERHSIGGQRVTLYSEGKRDPLTGRIHHRSRGTTAALRKKATSAMHSPARPFDYLSQRLLDETRERIPNFLLRGETT